jgi:hypothetical protein
MKISLRVLSCLLGAVLLAAALTGCGGDDNANAQSTTAKQIFRCGN